jgi:hypothetical protein
MDIRLNLSLLLKAWVVQYLLWALLCWLIWAWLGQRLLRARLLGMVAGVLPLSILACVLEELAWVLCFPYLPLTRKPLTFWYRLQFELKAEWLDGIIIFWSIFLLFRGVDYYLKYREKEAAASHLETELAQAQLRALRIHLNPHFLFNTLNSISSLMRTDVAGADLMLEQFSSILRIILQRGEVQLIRLCDEMEFVEMYMAMQDRRFAGRIHQEIRVDPALHDALVPVMILQPIVENAYGHGLSRLEGKGILAIEARRDGTQLVISIQNSGVGLGRPSNTPRDRENLGLKNVTNRLQLHYRDEHTFSIREAVNGNVQVTMTLPLQLSSSPGKELPAYGAG